MLGNPSVRLDSGALPKEGFCIRGFDLMDFVLAVRTLRDHPQGGHDGPVQGPKPSGS